MPDQLRLDISESGGQQTAATLERILQLQGQVSQAGQQSGQAAQQAGQQISTAFQQSASHVSLFNDHIHTTAGLFTRLPGPIGDVVGAFGALHLNLTSAQVGFLTLGTVAVEALQGTVHAAMEFERVMGSLRATLPVGQVAEFGGALRDTAEQLARVSVFNLSEVTAGFNELARTGANAGDIVHGLGVATTNLAAAMGTEPVAAARLLGSVMREWNLDTSHATEITNLLSQSVHVAGLSTEGLQTGLSRVGPVINALGGQLQDAVTGMELLARSGINAGRASMQLAQFYEDVINPRTTKAADLMKQLGIITEDGGNKFLDAEGKVRPFPELVKILSDSLGDATRSQEAYVLQQEFSRRGMEGALVMVNQYRTGGLERLTAAQNDARDAASAAHERLDNLWGSMKNLSSSTQTLAVDIGETLAPAIRPAVEALRDLVNAGIEGLPRLVGAVKETSQSEAWRTLRQEIDLTKGALDRLYAGRGGLQTGTDLTARVVTGQATEAELAGTIYDPNLRAGREPGFFARGIQQDVGFVGGLVGGAFQAATAPERQAAEVAAEQQRVTMQDMMAEVARRRTVPAVPATSGEGDVEQAITAPIDRAFHAAALTMDQLATMVADKSVKIKDALAQSTDPADIKATLDYEGAIRQAGQAVSQLADRDLAAYVQMLLNTNQVEEAAALGAAHLAAQHDTAARATDAAREAAKAHTDASREQAQALQETERAAKAASDALSSGYTSNLQAAFSAITTNLNAAQRSELEYIRVTQDVQTAVKTAFERAGASTGDFLNALSGTTTQARTLGQSVGANLAAGITAGINGERSTVSDSIGDVVAMGLDSAKLRFKITSPSQVFADEVGKPIGEGIAHGVRNTAETIAAAVDAAIRPGLSRASQAVGYIMGGLGAGMPVGPGGLPGGPGKVDFYYGQQYQGVSPGASGLGLEGGQPFGPPAPVAPGDRFGAAAAALYSGPAGGTSSGANLSGQQIVGYLPDGRPILGATQQAQGGGGGGGGAMASSGAGGGGPAGEFVPGQGWVAYSIATYTAGTGLSQHAASVSERGLNIETRAFDAQGRAEAEAAAQGAASDATRGWASLAVTARVLQEGVTGLVTGFPDVARSFQAAAEGAKAYAAYTAEALLKPTSLMTRPTTNYTPYAGMQTGGYTGSASPDAGLSYALSQLGTGTDTAYWQSVVDNYRATMPGGSGVMTTYNPTAPAPAAAPTVIIQISGDSAPMGGTLWEADLRAKKGQILSILGLR